MNIVVVIAIGELFGLFHHHFLHGHLTIGSCHLDDVQTLGEACHTSTIHIVELNQLSLAAVADILDAYGITRRLLAAVLTIVVEFEVVNDQPVILYLGVLAQTNTQLTLTTAVCL